MTQITNLGQVAYPPTYQAMQNFTASRDTNTPDELWMCEHPAVFTQGLAGKAEHVLNAGDIPIVQTNRGGQVTYHGLGQVVAYPMMDLKRAGYFVKEYVYRVEEAVIRTLMHFGVTGHRVKGAPGIYVRLGTRNSPRRAARGLQGTAGCALTLRADFLNPPNPMESPGFPEDVPEDVPVAHQNIALHGSAP